MTLTNEPKCPDCDSEVRYEQDPESPAVLHATILHDDTCPIWRGIQGMTK